tara:strand:+ start:461 stop:1732 length:1272 start_codon:yes stop_codon:yes gene_type:complete
VTLLTTDDNFFVNNATGEITKAVKVVVVDEGSLSRSYYSKYGRLECWSLNTERPADDVPSMTKQCSRCIDCPRNVTGSGQRTRECKFFTVIKLVLNDTHAVSKLRIAGGSLFSKASNAMGLYKYKNYLKSNGENLNTVITEIRFAEDAVKRMMYFKPAHLVPDGELENITRLILADADVNNLFNESANMNKLPRYILKNVEAKYPRIDQPYRFDTNAGDKGRTVPCLPTEGDAKYSLSFVLSKAQAKDLYTAMAAEYNAKKGESWTPKLANPFSKEEDGRLLGKSNIKAAYKTKPTGVPPQFDADNVRLADDFQLTTGSIINLALELYAYEMNGGGLNLRIRGVQVIDYIPYVPPSPFGEEEGYTQGDSVEKAEENADDIFAEGDSEDEAPVAAPVKRAKKKAPTPPADDDLSDVIKQWGTDD